MHVSGVLRRPPLFLPEFDSLSGYKLCESGDLGREIGLGASSR